MYIWQTATPLSVDTISVALVLPRGSRHDRRPNEHHIIEHLIFEKRMPDGSKIRDYADKSGTVLSGVTSRDSVTMTFVAPANKKHVEILYNLLSCIFLCGWKEEDEDKVVAIVESEILAIPSNMMKASKLSAELSYWGEESNLNHTYIQSSMRKSLQRITFYLKSLLASSLLLIDAPTNELYFLIRENEKNLVGDEVSTLDESILEKCKRDFTKGSIEILARPTNLSSLVLGINRRLNSLEQLSLLAITLCLSRNMRKGIIWDVMQSQNMTLYHMVSWFQPSLDDAVLVVDWITTPNSESAIKYSVVDLIKDLSEREDLLAQELPMAITEIMRQAEIMKRNSTTERLKAIAREKMVGKSSLSYEDFLKQIEDITPELCRDLLLEFTHSPILFIDQKARGQFEDLSGRNRA